MMDREFERSSMRTRPRTSEAPHLCGKTSGVQESRDEKQPASFVVMVPVCNSGNDQHFWLLSSGGKHQPSCWLSFTVRGGVQPGLAHSWALYASCRSWHLGPLLDRVPLHLTQLAVGFCSCCLAYAGCEKRCYAQRVSSLYDEAAVSRANNRLREQAAVTRHSHDWLAAIASFRRAGGLRWCSSDRPGAGRGLPFLSAGALAACVRSRALVHAPLRRVPENTLKFAVGVMLTAFGIFWTGEGLGVAWPGADLAIVAFAVLFLAVGRAAVAVVRRPSAEALP